MKLLKETNIDFISKMKMGFVISAIAVVLGLIFFVVRGERNFGIDFTGGMLQQIKFLKPTTANQLRSLFKSKGLDDVYLQEVHEDKQIIYIVRSSLEMADAVRSSLVDLHGKESLEVMREEVVGPTVGKDLRRQGLLALLFSLLGILIYVSFRFEFRFALGAILALFHDVLITVGVLACCQVEISLQILAALLTIVGYSLNDTIVVFDRIREVMKSSRKKDSLDMTINSSINQTLNRTLLTSITTFVVVCMLFIFGGEVIRDFSLALMVGVLVGTYSSVFIASSVLRLWAVPVKI